MRNWLSSTVVFPEGKLIGRAAFSVKAPKDSLKFQGQIAMSIDNYSDSDISFTPQKKRGGGSENRRSFFEWFSGETKRTPPTWRVPNHPNRVGIVGTGGTPFVHEMSHGRVLLVAGQLRLAPGVLRSL